MKAFLIQIAILVFVARNLLAAEDCAALSVTKPEDHLRLGECFASKGQWKEAEEHFRFYRQANPRSASATVSHAKALIRLNQPFDAVVELHDLLDLDPNSVSALKLYAALLEAALHNRPRAGELLEKCSRLAPADPEVWQALGNLYLNQQKTSEAIRSFEKANRLSPHDPLLMASLALGYGQASLSVRAAAQFARALQLNQRAAKPSSFVYLLYAEYLLSQNRAVESLPKFTKALLIDPHSSRAYYGRASAHEKIKDWKHAEADALAAIRESEKRKDAHLLLLRVYQAENNQEKMKKCIALIEKLTEEENAQQALERRSSQALQLYFEMVAPLLRAQKFAEAARHCEQIIGLEPSFYEPYFTLGVCYTQTGQPDQAETSFKKYLSLKPSSADGHAALGLVLLQQGRSPEAKVELERAIQLDPGLLEARKALASVHLSAADFSAAIAVLRPAAGSPDPDNEARLMLAEALLRNHDFASALSEVDLVLNSEPANTAATRLKQSIVSEFK